jgi:aquaporin Z
MKKGIAELVGTFTLVLFGCGSAVIAGPWIAGPTTVGVLGIALAFGLAIVAMAYGIGPVSGCHVNRQLVSAHSSPGGSRPAIS